MADMIVHYLDTYTADGWKGKNTVHCATWSESPLNSYSS